jgi:hypothetical protein
MKAVFVDESKHRNFFLSTVTLEVQDVATVRKTLAKLRMKGQSTIHLAKESASRRRLILDAIATLPIKVMFLDSSHDQERHARSESMKRLVTNLKLGDSYQIWIEADENFMSLDRRTITSELIARGMVERVMFQHASPSEQPLLWLPDAVGWARNRGGDWYRRVSSLTSK